MSITIKEMTDDDWTEIMEQALLNLLFRKREATTAELKEYARMEDEELEELRRRGLITIQKINEAGEGLYSLTATGVQKVLSTGARYDLNAIDFQIALTLARADLPISSLIAAALYKADDNNRAFIEGCWPQIASDYHLRRMSRGGILPKDFDMDTTEGPVDDVRRLKLSEGVTNVVHGYLKRLIKPINEMEKKDDTENS